jgi:hypothetical protein
MNYAEWRRFVDGYRRFYAKEDDGRIAGDYWQVCSSLKRIDPASDRCIALTALHYTLMELILEREIPV